MDFANNHVHPQHYPYISNGHNANKIADVQQQYPQTDEYRTEGPTTQPHMYNSNPNVVVTTPVAKEIRGDNRPQNNVANCLAVIATLFFLPTEIVACMYLSKASRAIDLTEAQQYYKRAKIFIILSFVIGIKWDAVVITGRIYEMQQESYSV